VGKTACPEGEKELRIIYENYSSDFKDKVLNELRAGRLRSRYLHNAVETDEGKVIVLQRHRTVEEIGQWLRKAGTGDGLILDNGGSVFTWAWWGVRDEAKMGDKIRRSCARAMSSSAPRTGVYPRSASSPLCSRARRVTWNLPGP